MDTDQMEYPCVCGKRFATVRGMKIHKTKKRCAGNHLNEQQRTASADQTSENQGQDLNHSAKDIHAVGSDEDFAQTLEARRQKLNLPRANETEEWTGSRVQIPAPTHPEGKGTAEGHPDS